MMDKDLQAKVDKLHFLLRSYGRVAVAFSAGVDSTVLLKAAQQVMSNEQILALTAESALMPASEIAAARAFCEQEGLRQQVTKLDLSRMKDVRNNPTDRCYYCKRLIFNRLRKLAGQAGFVHLLDGGNVDDWHDYRPGRRALRELGIISPLQEAGFTKADIRAYAAELGLSCAQKPASACLASRIPYREKITADKLKRIEQAEAYLQERGFHNVRVRSHENLARLELVHEDMARLADADLCNDVVKKLKELGFAYVTMDLQGYRQGSLNETIRR